MPDGYRALLDINVILDVLQRRQPFYEDSAAVLAGAAGPLPALAPVELLALLPGSDESPGARA